jgi:hypothetical protein
MQDHLEKLNAKAMSLRSTALSKVGMTPEDLAKLNMLPLITGIAGVFVIIIMWGAVMTPAWVTGTALHLGQPLKAHLSLTDVQFGASGELSGYVCGAGNSHCSLGWMCKEASEDTKTFADMVTLKTTPRSTWCRAQTAGAWALTMLWLGFIPGIIATVFTLFYAAKQIEVVGNQFAKVEKMGFTDRLQKYIVSGCWGAYWVFMFFAMTSYAAAVPDDLGWGGTNLESSFGLLRFAFFLVSIFSALLVASFFDLWHTDNVVEAWAEFTQTDLLTAKKALYLLLMFQMALYLLYTIVEVDWSMLLVVIAGYYLDAKKRNFMLMYLVIVSVTVLLDVIKIAAMPNIDTMTPGAAFGAVLYFFIFMLKFAIVGAIYMYQRKEDASPTAFAFSQMPDGAGRGDDEIAE